MREQDFYIPPDVAIDNDGNWAQTDSDKVLRLDNNYDQYVLSFTGMGMPPLQYITQRGPEQHGEDLLLYRLQPRIIQYVYRYNGRCDRDTYWAARGNLIDYLRPNRHSGTTRIQYGRLRKIWPDGTVRDIDALIDSGPIFAPRKSSEWDEWSFTETLRFRCPETVWYDPDRQDIVWATDIVEGLIFYHPVSAPDHLTFEDNMLFGISALSGSSSVVYSGTWRSYPTIYITGPLTSPTVRNLTLGMELGLDYVVSAGEIVTINTAYGNKTITNNTGDNLIGTLSSSSDMEFYIAPAPEAPNGINELTIQGGTATPATEVSLTYYTRYIGI